jgi:glycosyltransferase involved in cell wall biosynthesis
MNKTIFILLPSLKYGGAERVAINLATELQNQGCLIKFLLMNKMGDYLREVEENFEVVNLNCNRTYKLPYLLSKYINNNNVDVIISNFWKLNLCACAVKILSKKIKLILWEHSPPSITPESSGWKYKLSASLLYRCADSVVAVSDGVRDDIIKFTYGLKDKVIRIYNPIKPPPNIQTNKKIDKSQQLIISVGRLTTEKNIKLLIESYALTVNKIKTKLLIVGEGEKKDELMELTKLLNLEQYVEFFGYSDNVYELMDSSDLLVMSSNFEGFGNVIVEALFCGLSIVSTDCDTGPREILNNNEFGSLVSLNDPLAMSEAMIKELSNPRSKEKQMARAELFLPSKIAKQFLSIM